MYLTKLSSNGQKCSFIFQKTLNFTQAQCHKELHKKRQTHYDVLGLKETCSQADIKAAFISLSKEFHPDKLPKGVDGKAYHAKFVVLNDAYSTLGKPDSRADYDSTLKVKPFNGVPKAKNTSGFSDEPIIFTDRTIWNQRDKSEDSKYSGRHYYGMDLTGRKIPNTYILTGVLTFMVVGMILQYNVARWWTNFTRQQIDRNNNNIAQSYRAIRERALNTDARRDHFQKVMGETERRTGEASHLSPPE